MPSLSLSFDVLDVWDVGCFVYECFWMLHLNLPRSHWEDLYRPFVTCHLSPVTCHLSQCRTQCRGHRSHSWRCGRVHWWAVMRWTSGFLPSNLRMCSWRRAWVEIKFNLCRCLSLSSNKNLMHLESCFRITPLSSDAAFAERMRLALGTGVFEDQAQGRLTVITPLFPDEFKFGVITRDNQTMKLQVVMFDNWHLHLRGLWKQVWARSCDSNDWPVVGHSQLIILRCKIFQIWIDFFPGTSITGKARLESQSLFHKLSSVTCLSKSLCSWFQFQCLIIFSCRWSWGVLVSVKTFFMSLGLVTWCLGKSFKSGCGQDGSRQGLP